MQQWADADRRRDRSTVVLEIRSRQISGSTRRPDAVRRFGTHLRSKAGRVQIESAQFLQEYCAPNSTFGTRQAAGSTVDEQYQAGRRCGSAQTIVEVKRITEQVDRPTDCAILS